MPNLQVTKKSNIEKIGKLSENLRSLANQELPLIKKNISQGLDSEAAGELLKALEERRRHLSVMSEQLQLIVEKIQNEE